MVYRLGTRHVHLAARHLPGHRPARCRAGDPVGLGANRVAGDAAQPADASLWYVVAVQAFLDDAERREEIIRAADRRALDRAIMTIIEGYAAGTRHGIRMDDDGLIAAGEPDLQVTWMDARNGRHVVTPRIGKPVDYRVNVIEDVTTSLWYVVTVILMMIPPIVTSIRASGFESRRWAESDHGSSGSSNEDADDDDGDEGDDD